MPKIDETMLQRARTMRADGSPVEANLWAQLRNKRLSGIKFARQVVIGPYIADFVARSHKLIIELDGDTHGLTEDYDQKRTEQLEKQGYRVLRFGNSDVTENLEGVLEMIVGALKNTPSPQPSPRGGGGEGEE